MWAMPEEYVKRIEAHEATRNKTSKKPRKVVERQEKEGAALDAMWEKLDETTRNRIEDEVEEKLGIGGRMGRGDAARIVFRRAALRELFQQLNSG